jgi:prepilin-type N-terminal cleavage/methylation domain-containing protein
MGTQRFDIHDLGADEGFSLIELVTVMSILPVILAVAFLLFNGTTQMSARVEARSGLTDDTRAGIDLMTRELRQADQIVDGAGVFATTQPRQAIFYVDLNHDNAPERVSYFMNGLKLVRTQASATTSVPPFSYGPDGPQRTLISTMSAGFSGPIFTYFDTSGAVLGSSQSAQCSAVGLHVISSTFVPGGTNENVTVDMSTWVKIRSIFNSIQ